MEANINTSENTEKKSGNWLKKWLWRTLILGILCYGLFVLFGYFFTYSQGYRAGKLLKFSNKGFVFKTWEGQIYLGTITPDDASGISSKYWDFSVDRGNSSIIHKLEDAMLSKHEVRLHYREKVVKFSWRGDTRYFVDSISEVK